MKEVQRKSTEKRQKYLQGIYDILKEGGELLLMLLYPLLSSWQILLHAAPRASSSTRERNVDVNLAFSIVFPRFNCLLCHLLTHSFAVASSLSVTLSTVHPLEAALGCPSLESGEQHHSTMSL